MTPLQIRASDSGPTEIYLNGVLACRLPGNANVYDNVTIAPEALEGLRPGPNGRALHSRAPRSMCVQRGALLIAREPETPLR